MNTAKLATALRLAAEALEAAPDERFAPAPRSAYTSSSLPPDCPSKSRFHAVVKGIASATKLGRAWTVPVADWDMARRRGSRVEKRPAPPDDVAATVLEMTRAFRATR